jgi:hypothetical protein
LTVQYLYPYERLNSEGWEENKRRSPERGRKGVRENKTCVLWRRSCSFDNILYMGAGGDHTPAIGRPGRKKPYKIVRCHQ